MENVQHNTVTTEVGPWAMVPVWVLTYLHGAEVAVYVALRSFADQKGAAHPRVKTIAERAGVSERTVERAVAKMRDLDLLRTLQWNREDGSIGGCHYYLRDLPPAPASLPPDAPVATPGDAPVATPGDAPVATPGDAPVGARTHQVEHPSKNTPTTNGRPTLADKASDLADVVVGGCGSIGRSITRKTLLEECTTLAGLGWTTQDLKWAVDGRTWHDCRAGAVITWLRGLSSPPVRSIGDPRDARGFAPPCPNHPSEPAGHCTKCAAEAVQPPMNWRDLVASSWS